MKKCPECEKETLCKVEGVIMLAGPPDGMDQEDVWECECGYREFKKTGEKINIIPDVNE